LRLEDFFIAYGKQDRAPGRIRRERLRALPSRRTPIFAVYKITKRRDEDITAVLGAFYLTLDEDGTSTTSASPSAAWPATPKRARGRGALIGSPGPKRRSRRPRPSPITSRSATGVRRRNTADGKELMRFYLETSPAE
jgi:xanthine dehydrogenase small subunit